MKKLFFSLAFLFCGIVVMAQKQADIKFENDTISLGTFSEKDAIQEVCYTFTNTGDAPLVLNQVVASCGCTVPEYDKKPVRPGEGGTIKVTYNGKGKLLGPFTKIITVRSNAQSGVRRLFLMGDMTK